MEIFQKKAGPVSSWRGQTQSSYHHGERRLDRVPEKGSVPLDDTRSQRSWRWGERTPFVLVTFLIAKMKYLRKATYRVCFCSQLGGIVPHGEGGTVADGWSYRVPREGAEEVIADTPFTFFLLWHQGPTHGMGLSAFRAGLPCSPKPFLKHPCRASQDVFPRWL